jgi:hypothetical protein
LNPDVVNAVGELSTVDPSVALNRAYAKFKEKALGEASSSLGAFAAEGREALGMVRNRIHSLYRGYKDLRRGDFNGFANRFGLNARRVNKRLTRYDPSKKWLRNPRDTADFVGSAWLEYWFGWAPMVGDIYGALEVLEQPLPWGKFKGSGRHYQSSYWNPAWYYPIVVTTRNVIGQVGAEVQVVNGNQFLRSQVGLQNPFAVAWEVIPFSFFVDWCFDVGDWISSYTDFFGCSVEQAYHTVFTVGKQTWEYNFHDIGLQKSDFEGFHMKRNASMYRPVPNMNLTANLGQSLTRTASSLALLTGITAPDRSSRRLRL